MHTKHTEMHMIGSDQNSLVKFKKTFTYATEQICDDAIAEMLRKTGMLGYQVLYSGPTEEFKEQSNEEA